MEDLNAGEQFCIFQDSYVLNYFDAMDHYLRVGAPVYFVVQSGHDYTTEWGQNQICDSQGCPEQSVLGQVFQASRVPSK
jgi:Niemann-Pick C1 protein